MDASAPAAQKGVTPGPGHQAIPALELKRNGTGTQGSVAQASPGPPVAEELPAREYSACGRRDRDDCAWSDVGHRIRDERCHHHQQSGTSEKDAADEKTLVIRRTARIMQVQGNILTRLRRYVQEHRDHPFHPRSKPVR